MKLPVQNPKTNNYQSLEDIQARKDELLDQAPYREHPFQCKMESVIHG